MAVRRYRFLPPFANDGSVEELQTIFTHLGILFANCPSPIGDAAGLNKVRVGHSAIRASESQIAAKELQKLKDALKCPWDRID